MENTNEEISQDHDEIVTEKPLIKDIEWKTEHEIILVEWADKAMCYRWLHARSHQAYSKTNAWYTIPVIIMSTLTGTANFAQDRFPEDIKPLAQMGIGAVNIFAGILTTIAQFLKIGELNEAHRVSSISWDKFYRNIKVELAKSRDERMHVGHMLKMCKEEFDRLMETSPSIPEASINLFKKTFLHSKDAKVLEKMEMLKLPDICDIIVSAEETRHHWYKDTGKHVSEIEMRVEGDLLQRQKDMRKKEIEMRDIENKLKEKQDILVHYEKQKIEKYDALITEYQQLFERLQSLTRSTA